MYLQAFLFIISVIITTTPAFLPHLRTDAVLKDISEALRVIFENGISNQVTSVALLISATIQARSFYLSTYHAAIVLNLSWILTLSMFFSPLTLELYCGEKRDQLKNKAIAISFIALFGAVFKGAFGFWVTLSPTSFHGTSNATGACELQNIKYFMVGRNFTANAPFFRYFWLATYGSILLAYAVPFLHFSREVLRTIMGMMLSGNQPEPRDDSDLSFGLVVELETGHSSPKVLAVGVIITALAAYLFAFIVFPTLLFSAGLTLALVRDEIQKQVPVTWRRWLMGRWSRLVERPLRLMEKPLRLMERPLRLMESPLRLIGWRALGEKWFLYLCGILVPAGAVVGFIIATELTIKANAGLVLGGENEWSLAQTLAVLLVLPNAFMVVKCAWVMVKALRKPSSRETSSGTGEEGQMPQYGIDPYVPQWDGRSTTLYRGHGVINNIHHHHHDPYVRGSRLRGGRYRRKRL